MVNRGTDVYFKKCEVSFSVTTLEDNATARKNSFVQEFWWWFHSFRHCFEWKWGKVVLMKMQHSTLSRVQYSMTGTAIDLAHGPFLIFSPTLCLGTQQPHSGTKCSIFLTEMSAKAPSFKKWWPRYLHLNAAGACHMWSHFRPGTVCKLQFIQMSFSMTMPCQQTCHYS